MFQTMAGILVGMLAFLAGLSLTLTPLKDAKGQPAGMPQPLNQPPALYLDESSLLSRASAW
jgi:hypothetical protein